MWMAAVILGSLDITARPAEVAPARRWLCALLGGHHAAIIDDVVLMACEAITNSIRHSESGIQREKGKPGKVTLLVIESDDALRVEVADAGSRHSVPEVAGDDPDAVSGRGLHLIDALSAGRWGTYACDDGRTVWFEVGR
jgi:anti-sigma regulatory factor (Ser/Thr protein kinase)